MQMSLLLSLCRIRTLSSREHYNKKDVHWISPKLVIPIENKAPEIPHSGTKIESHDGKWLTMDKYS